MQAEKTHVVGLLHTNTSNDTTAVSFYMPTDTYINTTMPVWPGSRGNTSVKIRTAAFNTNNPNNSSILLFSNKLVEISNNLTSNINLYYNAADFDNSLIGKYYSIR